MASASRIAHDLGGNERRVTAVASGRELLEAMSRETVRRDAALGGVRVRRGGGGRAPSAGSYGRFPGTAPGAAASSRFHTSTKARNLARVGSSVSDTASRKSASGLAFASV